GFRAAAQAGRPPGPEVTDGLIGLLGALLLALPGLVSGVVGLLLLVPPLRRLAGGGVRRATERRVSSMVAGDLFGPRRVRVYRGAPQPAPEPAPAPSPSPVTDPGKAIEGEIVDR
ncbi:FxsA family protein, partial [Micromonospora sp. NPDC005313]